LQRHNNNISDHSIFLSNTEKKWYRWKSCLPRTSSSLPCKSVDLAMDMQSPAVEPDLEFVFRTPSYPNTWSRPAIWRQWNSQCSETVHPTLRHRTPGHNVRVFFDRIQRRPSRSLPFPDISDEMYRTHNTLWDYLARASKFQWIMSTILGSMRWRHCIANQRWLNNNNTEQSINIWLCGSEGNNRSVRCRPTAR